jgi:hypothetical protein
MTEQRNSPVVLSFQQKIFASVVTTLIVAMLGWTASSVIGVKEQLPVIRLEIQHLRETIRIGMEDRYTGSAAESAFALRDARIANIETKVSIVEERVRSLEGR